jgi:hypothetical protein
MKLNFITAWLLSGPTWAWTRDPWLWGVFFELLLLSFLFFLIDFQ